MEDGSAGTALSFRDRLVERLISGAVQITDAWIEAAAERPDLSLGALRNEIPEFLQDLAASIRDGEADVRRASQDDYLKMHVEERLAQGYSVQQVLDEFEALPATLYGVMDELLASSPEVSPREVHEVHRDLSRELHRVGRVAAHLYRKIEMEQRRGLARQLTNFGQALEHEIRGPLHTAQMAVNLLEKPEVREVPDSHDEYLGVLRGRLQRIAELLTEVRRFSAAQHSLAEEEWIPAREVVEETFQELELMAESRGVELRAGRVEEDVYLAVPRLRLAVRNLVANAIKYSDPEEESPYVEVSLGSPPDGPHRLTVEDNGIGVPEEARERIFEPGQRAHPDRGSGTGLGLAIVRQVLEQRRGRVGYEPKDKGSRFVLELPAPLAVREG